MAKSTEPRVLSPRARVMACAAFAFFLAAPCTRGQNPPVQVQSQAARANLDENGNPVAEASPQPVIQFSGQKRAPAYFGGWALPYTPGYGKSAQAAPAPKLDISRPLVLQARVNPAGIPDKTPMASTLRVAPRRGVCSVPLLLVHPPPGTHFTIKLVPAPPTDPAMVVKPLAPSCDEVTSAPEPGIAPPPMLKPRWPER
jgi:hypothetical protein